MNSKIYSTVAVVIVVLALIAGGIILALYFTGMFDLSRPEPEPVGFSVTIDDEIYNTDTEGLVIASGTNIIVGTDEYTVTIGAAMPSEDMTFIVGTELWSWSDISEWDMTSCFDISVGEKSFILGYTGFPEIIARAFGVNEAEVKTGAASAGDIFELIITSGNDTLSFGFTLTDVSGTENYVSLDKEHIVF